MLRFNINILNKKVFFRTLALTFFDKKIYRFYNIFFKSSIFYYETGFVKQIRRGITKNKPWIF